MLLVTPTSDLFLCADEDIIITKSQPTQIGTIYSIYYILQQFSDQHNGKCTITDVLLLLM